MRSRLAAAMLVWFLLGAVGGSASPEEFQASVQYSGSVMVLRVPLEGVMSSNLVVSGPEGYRVERDFGRSTLISADLGKGGDGQELATGLLEGTYKWELRVDTGTLSEPPAAESVPGSPMMAGSAGAASEQWVATGRFRVEDGHLVGVPSEKKAGDQRGGGAVQRVTGQGSSMPLPMTSFTDYLYVSGGICSGCADGDADLVGGELLVKDVQPWITMRDTVSDQRWRWKSYLGPLYLESSRLNGASSVTPVVIEKDTPSNTLYVDSAGVVGIGTSTPSTFNNASGLDIVQPHYPTVRLKSTMSGAHTWTLWSDSTKFGLTDETAVRDIIMVWNGAPQGTLQIQGDGTVLIKGMLTIGSSREYKDNIRDLTVEEATNVLHGLNPVAFVHKAGGGEQHIGFIAEDVPESVATKDRKGLSPMDIVAVLTKVVQKQRSEIQEQQKAVQEQQKTNQKQATVIKTLTEKLAQLEAKIEDLQPSGNLIRILCQK